jgi:hypothetical protein
VKLTVGSKPGTKLYFLSRTQRIENDLIDQLFNSDGTTVVYSVYISQQQTNERIYFGLFLTRSQSDWKHPTGLDQPVCEIFHMRLNFCCVIIAMTFP